jgi:diguanylate cyclase (GGDEF)-like protein
LCDIDDFKAINDQHGHASGDRVLTTVAETLGHSLRAGDIVARLGGDEFAVLAAGLTLTQSERRLAVIARTVQEACRAIFTDGTSPTLSIGVAECSAGDTLESLQQRADEALYQAKRNGKGRLATKASPLLRDLRNAR